MRAVGRGAQAAAVWAWLLVCLLAGEGATGAQGGGRLLWRRASNNLVLSVSLRGNELNYSIAVYGSDGSLSAWLEAQPDTPRVFCGGEWFSPRSGLTVQQASHPDNTTLAITWVLGPHGKPACAGKRFVTTIESGARGSTSDDVQFRQAFPDGLADTAGLPQPGAAGASTQFNGSSTAPVSEFPAIAHRSGTRLFDDLGYVTWAGVFSYTRAMHGVGLAGYLGGSEGGPLLLHEGVTSTTRSALVLSPATAFMSTILALRPQTQPACKLVPQTDFQHFDCPGGARFNVSTVAACAELCRLDTVCRAFSFGDHTCWRKYSTQGRTTEAHTSGTCAKDDVLVGGVQGLVQSIPPGHETGFVVSAAAGAGISAALDKWGAGLRAAHNTTRILRDADLIATKLGYWTDNGAYYYGGNQPNASTLGGVVDGLRKALVPVQYVQLDPWVWSPCVHEPRPELLPDGLAGLSRELALPLLLYTFFWCPEASARAYNVTFVDSQQFENKGHGMQVAQPAPDEALGFYSRFLAEDAGVLGGFEVDFLNWAYLAFPAFHTTVQGNSGWFAGLAGAVAQHEGVSLQLCMGLPSYFLEALHHPAVTNARASGDDFPSNGHRWLIGYTGALMRPLDLLPFMDVVWTAPVQPGNPYNVTHRRDTALYVAVSALASGPVGLGDGRGLTNASLALRLCTAEGTLLHPGRLAVPIDRMYDKAVVPTVYDGELGGPEVWVASTQLGGRTWWAVLAVNASHGFPLSAHDLAPAPAEAGAPLYMAEIAACTNNTACGAPFPTGPGASTALTTPPNSDNGYGFGVFTIAAPCAASGTVFLGEAGKGVGVSPARLAAATCTSTGACVQLRPLETPGLSETVTLLFVVGVEGGGGGGVGTALFRTAVLRDRPVTVCV